MGLGTAAGVGVGGGGGALVTVLTGGAGAPALPAGAYIGAGIGATVGLGVGKAITNRLFNESGDGSGGAGDARPERQRLSPGEIKRLKKAGLDPEELKEFDGKADLFKDKAGDIFVHPKNGSGPGEPTGFNIYNLPKPPNP